MRVALTWRLSSALGTFLVLASGPVLAHFGPKPLTDLPGFANVSAAALFFQTATISMIQSIFQILNTAVTLSSPAVHSSLHGQPWRSFRPLARIQAGPLMPCCFGNGGECRVSLLPDRPFVPGAEREPARIRSVRQVRQVRTAVVLVFWTRAEKSLGIQAAVVLVFSFMENKFWIGL